MRLLPTAIAMAIGMTVTSTFADVTESRSTQDDRQSMAITIYNSNLALVKETRKVSLKPGLNKLALRDVSAQIRSETALLTSASAPGSMTLLEQNFDYDLLTPNKLLEKYVGKTVSIVKTHPTTGAETTEQATVLSANNGVVLKVGNRIETGVAGRIVYSDVPANLRDKPTLVTQVDNRGANEQTLELSYLTSGLSWKADYVAELNATEDKLDLNGLVTLSNTSGASYNNAKLQLVAGNVNQVSREVFAKNVRGAPMVAMAASAPSMAQEDLFEYKLYTLNRATSIAENQTKQVALLSASSVPVSKELLISGDEHYYRGQYGDLGSKLKAGVFVEFTNNEASKLGMPLPKGILRVYKKDSAGNAQFIGENNIEHTAKNESIRVKLGEAFDVTADKKQTSFKVLPNPAKGIEAYESAYEYTLKNAKKESVKVSVREPIGGDWKILNQSHVSSKLNSNTAQWQIEIPAEGSVTLTYRVLVKY